jgi:nucleoside-diphosphate-sugar epimerase
MTADIVFHIAGEKRDDARMWEVNLEGARRLLEWSARHGVKRFVYLSSVGVYGARKNAGVIQAGAPKHPSNTYESSKSAAEDLVRQKCGEYGMEYVILQPSNVIGWVDGRAYPLLGLMKMIQRGWFTYFGSEDACFNYVAVEDVASALVAATTPGAANRAFIVNSPVSMQQFVGWIAEELGVPPPARRLPAMVGRAAAFLADVLGGATGRSIPFGRERFTELTNTTRYDGSPARDALGDVYSMGVESAVRRLVQRYRKEGLL